MKDIMKSTNGFQNYIEKRNISFEQEDLAKRNNIKMINNKFEKDSKNKEINNEYDDLFIMKNNNNIISYYYKTAVYLKNSKKYSFINSKNYIPKDRYNSFCRNYNKGNKYNEKYINNYQQINNCIYELNNKTFYYNEQQLRNIKEYNNFVISAELIKDINKVNKDINNYLYIKSKEGKGMNGTNGYFENFNLKCPQNIINNINCPPFIPTNYNIKKQEENKSCSHLNKSLSKDKDKESDSTSAISEKREEENNFDCVEHSKKNKNKELNMDKCEYLVEMFGRKGWVCKLCNNFNYEKRNKCNRCGIIKKPKNIIDLKLKIGNKEFNEKQINNKKGDWICLNCRNLNYSFRTFCNRCKIPKINQFINDIFILKNEEKNNFPNYPIYSFSPSFIYFNNVSNI